MCNVHVCGGSGHGVGRLFQVFDAEGGDGGVDVVGRWACLVVRCVRDQSCVQPHWPTAQQPHISRAAGWQAPNVGERHGTFSWTQEAMCWSTFTSRSTLGLRKARAKYWIGLGTGKPVSEYSYWGSRSSMAGGRVAPGGGSTPHAVALLCRTAGGCGSLPIDPFTRQRPCHLSQRPKPLPSLLSPDHPHSTS